MGQTNIHRASALLSRAGISFEDQARIEPCGKEIYLNFESLPQEEINKIGPLLNHGSQDTWVSRNITDYRFRPVSAPPPIAYPKVCVSFGLKERLTRDPMSSYSTPRKPDELPNEALGFIIVVQGANASERSKVVTKTTLEAVARAMLYEAVNGYSIVFSGAILKTNLTKVFGDLRGVANFTFTKVKDIADLNEMDAVKDKAGHFKMGILC